MRDFEDFFRVEYETVLRALVLALGERQRAEEAAQDAFATAFRRWRSVSKTERPGTWVYVVALRAERRRLARAARRETAAAEPAPLDESTATLDAVWIAGALSSLTERQRLATVLRYYADLSVEDVAKVMGCAPGTVKATVHAALGRLRVNLVEQEGIGAN